MGLKTRPVYSLPDLPPALNDLQRLVGNLWWSWQPEAEALFAHLDEPLWHAVHHNPIALLQQISPERLEQAARDTRIQRLLQHLVQQMEEELSGPALWPPQVVYLSFEFGIHESLPLYAGGLGVLAGDHLKEASDQGFPLVGVGVLFRAGYFTQALYPEGRQKEIFQEQPIFTLPLETLVATDNTPLTLQIPLQGTPLFFRIRLVRVGRAGLFLLDPHIPENPPALRAIAQRLYPAEMPLRLKQELLLGRGAVQLMAHLGVRDVRWHLNEGHPAFSVYERLRMGESLEQIRETTLFTTHTPVPAGHDRFPVERVREMIQPGPDEEEVWAHCLKLAEESSHTWNMSLLALRGSGRVNAVSNIHAKVSQDLFRSLLSTPPRIHAITNGVHPGTWADPVWIQRVQHRSNPSLDEVEDLWQVHMEWKRALAREILRRVARLMEAHRLPEEWKPVAGASFHPEILTLGFARRFTGYKRAYLLFQDPERLLRLLHHPAGPVQLIFAGKAHPRDEDGKRILQKILDFARRPEVEGRIVVLENYDMGLARLLTRGVDVWLNTPRAPLEASGTSGQKAALNGVLNVSVLDGWWPEAYDGQNGWGIPSDPSLPDEMQDTQDREALFHVLENEVVPLYYNSRETWVQRMVHATRSVLEGFTTGRMFHAYRAFFYEEPLP